MIRAYFETQNDFRIAAAIQAKLVRGILSPSTKRGLFVRLIISLWFTFSVSSFLSVAGSRIGTPTLIPEIGSYLLPGRPLPKAALCENGDAGSRFILQCTAFQERLGPVHYAYDQRIHLIRSASATVGGTTIGDLILTWGTPDSYRCGYGNVQVYWGEKSAFVSAPLKPNSQVKVILYYLNQLDMPNVRLVWRGFITAYNPSVIGYLESDSRMPKLMMLDNHQK